MNTVGDGANGYPVQPMTAMQKTQWRGLTTAECKVLWNLTKKPTEFAQAIEAKLRERNSSASVDNLMTQSSKSVDNYGKVAE